MSTPFRLHGLRLEEIYKGPFIEKPFVAYIHKNSIEHWSTNLVPVNMGRTTSNLCTRKAKRLALLYDILSFKNT